MRSLLSAVRHLPADHTARLRAAPLLPRINGRLPAGFSQPAGFSLSRHPCYNKANPRPKERTRMKNIVVLATGGTVAATADLVRRLGGSLVAVTVLMELVYLDPRDVLAQWRRLLSPDGFVMFSVLGPGSFPELRSLYQARGWAPPCHAFTDIHDWGDMLHQAGFADVVMDAECLTLTFATPQRLLQELREMGHNLSSGRSGITRARGWLQQWYEAVQTLALPDGQLPLTFEIIYGHAFKPAPRVRVAEHSSVSLQDMRAMLHAGRSSTR